MTASDSLHDSNDSPIVLDAADQQILDLLTEDGRASARDIAKQTNLSPATVARRIARLEKHRVIRGYSAIVDTTPAGRLNAFTEIRLNGDVETGSLESRIRQMPEAVQYFTISGDPDALVHFIVNDVDHLQRVVNSLRRTGMVTGTKTLIVMKSWRRSLGH